MRKIYIFLVFLIIIPIIYAESSYNFITIGQGDNRYCKQGGSCNLTSLTVVNQTVTNINTTNINASNIYINGTNINNIFWKTDGSSSPSTGNWTIGDNGNSYDSYSIIYKGFDSGSVISRYLTTQMKSGSYNIHYSDDDAPSSYDVFNINSFTGDVSFGSGAQPTLTTLISPSGFGQFNLKNIQDITAGGQISAGTLRYSPTSTGYITLGDNFIDFINMGLVEIPIISNDAVSTSTMQLDAYGGNFGGSGGGHLTYGNLNYGDVMYDYGWKANYFTATGNGNSFGDTTINGGGAGLTVIDPIQNDYVDIGAGFLTGYTLKTDSIDGLSLPCQFNWLGSPVAECTSNGFKIGGLSTYDGLMTYNSGALSILTGGYISSDTIYVNTLRNSQGGSSPVTFYNDAGSGGDIVFLWKGVGSAYTNVTFTRLQNLVNLNANNLVSTGYINTSQNITSGSFLRSIYGASNGQGIIQLGDATASQNAQIYFDYSGQNNLYIKTNYNSITNAINLQPGGITVAKFTRANGEELTGNLNLTSASSSLVLSNSFNVLGGVQGRSGIVSLSGYGNTNNENILFNFEGVANQIGISSTTGVTNYLFQGTSGIRISQAGNHYMQLDNAETGNTISTITGSNFNGATFNIKTFDSTGILNLQNGGMTFLSATNGNITINGTINQTVGNIVTIGNITANYANFNQYHGGMFTSSETGVAGMILNSTLQKSTFLKSNHVDGFNWTDANTTLQLMDSQGAGHYQVIWNAQETGTNNHVYIGYIFVNEVQQNNTMGHAVGQQSNEFDISGEGFIELANGDKVTLRLKDNTGTTSTPTIFIKNLNLIRFHK